MKVTGSSFRKALIFGGLGILLLASCILAVHLWHKEALQRWREEAQQYYPMRVDAFYAQAAQIKKGMPIDEVRGSLRGVTRETSSTSVVHFWMQPERYGPGLTTQFINVHIDDQQRVIRVTTTDG